MTRIRKRDQPADRFAENPALDAWHRRHHEAQADETRDTTAKRNARRAGLPTVQCPCGAEFPSAVR